MRGWGWGGGHSEGADCYNFLHFLWIKNLTLCILKTATRQEAKLSNNLDGNFVFLVANFFSPLKKKQEQKGGDARILAHSATHSVTHSVTQSLSLSSENAGA